MGAWSPVTIGRIFDMVGVGIQTDLMLLRPFADFDRTSAGLRVATRGFPTYWFGNMLVVDDMPDDPRTAIAMFQSEFSDVPDIRHITFLWDSGPLDAEIKARYVAAGFDIDVDCTLTTAMPNAPKLAPQGIDLRPIVTQADYDQVVALQFEIGKDDYPDADDYLTYLRQNIDTHRKRVAAGMGQWFGAFEDDRLVSNMGLFAQNGIARYQEVGTEVSYRGRGIASALIHYAAQSIKTQHAVQTFVIVAMDQSNAQRLYVKCGFALLDKTYSACRRPPGQA